MSITAKYRVRIPRWMRWIFADAVWTIPSTEGDGPIAYLTFDDGPVTGVTDKILDILLIQKVHATFFCIGRQVHENTRIYNRIHAEGHAVGNHSYSHISGLKMSATDYLEDVSRCDELIDSLLFRPPYGKMKRSQYRQLKKERKIIMYHVISGDFYLKNSPTTCLRNVLENVENGSIIVMHDNDKVGWKTVEYLPELISVLKTRGYRLEAISP